MPPMELKSKSNVLPHDRATKKKKKIKLDQAK